MNRTETEGALGIFFPPVCFDRFISQRQCLDGVSANCTLPVFERTSRSKGNRTRDVTETKKMQTFLLNTELLRNADPDQTFRN